MKIKHTIITIIMLFLSFTVVAKESGSSSLTALSAWTNQSGSTLYINTIDSSGLLTGTFINRAAGYGCQNISYPVTGWVYGTAITFTTIWKSTTESCNSITAWTGFYYQGKITTVWQLTINNSTSMSQIIQGKDVFKPSSSTTKKSLIMK